MFTVNTRIGAAAFCRLSPIAAVQLIKLSSSAYGLIFWSVRVRLTGDSIGLLILK